jgi:hypothetical protein
VAGLGGRGGVAAAVVVFSSALEHFDFKWGCLFTVRFGLFFPKNLCQNTKEAGNSVP